MNVLSTVSLCISIVGVIISVSLFNASINNGRKVLLKKILYMTTYDICFMFSPLEKDENKIKNKTKWERSMIKIGQLFDELKFNSKISIPGISFSQSVSKKDNTIITEQFFLDSALSRTIDYYKSRNIKGFDLLLEGYDGRVYLSQHYHRVYIYTHFLFVGPINGVKIVYKRNKKIANYGGHITKITPKKIRNMKDFRKYYDKCYMDFNFSKIIPKNGKNDILSVYCAT